MKTTSLFLSLFLVLSLSLSSLVLFVVSSPGLVLNVDVRDELLGYAADVRLYAVSCLQPHLGISFLLPRHPPLLFSAMKNASIETNPKSADNTFSHFGLQIQGAWACLYLEFSSVYIIRQTILIIYATSSCFLFLLVFFFFFFSHISSSCWKTEGTTRGGHKSRLLFVWRTGGQPLAM